MMLFSAIPWTLAGGFLGPLGAALLGLFAGLLRGVLMALLCVYAIGLWPHEYLRNVVRKQSIVGRTVFQYAPPVIEKLNAIRWLDVGVKPPLTSSLPPIPELPVEKK